jgi:lipopolysaccharide transport system permease protein
MPANSEFGERSARLEEPRSAPPAVLRTVTIRADSRWRVPDLVELWTYRELFWVLAARDIKVRYKQTALGAAWAVIQPLGTMVVFTMISRVGKFSTNGVRPEVFYYCGMLPWLLFANSLSSAGNSLVSSQNLIAKVYFPRLVIPVSSVITALVDFAIAFVVLLVLMAFYRVSPAPQIVLVPAFMVLGFLAATGFGLWLSSLNALFRDIRHVAPFITQLWLFVTPVLYSSSAVTVRWQRVLLGLNPISGIVEGVRWCVLGKPAPGYELATSVAIIVLVLASGLVYFARVERTLADRL